MRLLFEADLGDNPLKGKKIAVIGFGNQGRAHAGNLRDSGFEVAVGARAGGASRERAGEAGYEVLEISAAARWADLIALLAPDEEHGGIYSAGLEPFMKKGKTLLFAHGFSVHFGQVIPPSDVDVVMVSPKGPGHQVRQEYLAGRGVVMLVGVHQEATGKARETALGYASAIGGGRAGIFESTFREECETDLFGEQAVICGGLSHMVAAGFDTLVEAGYQPEMAYFECLHEVKLVADLIHRRGIAGMRQAISNTAEFGDLSRGPRVIGPAVRKEMKKILEEIRSGRFAREWVEDNRTGGKRFSSLRAGESGHSIDVVGAQVRKLLRLSEKDS